MLINKHQFDSLGERSFVERFRGTLKESFPEQVRGISASDLDAQILIEVRNAAEYGMVSEQSAATFVMTGWLLGRGFDTRIPAVQEQLRNDQLSEYDKATWLESFTVALLKTLQE